MHLKRFRGETVREALQAARAELGPHAIVLGTRLVRRRGWRGCAGQREVEISAAVEREVSEDRTSAPGSGPSAPAAGGELVARLAATGLSPAIAAEIAAGVPRGRVRRTSASDLRTAVTAWSDAFACGDRAPDAIDVFVGPPGAGKTTSIAKIAALQRVRGGRRVSLVSADGFRVGAIEQLRLYAGIIGAPFAAARSAGELRQALAEAAAPVLVDTAGRSPDDTASREMFAVLAGMRGVRLHMVLPAGITPAAANRLLDAHAAAGARPEAVVITKLDEREPAAPLASVLRQRGLRVSYLGVGQRVPEDLVPATPAALAAALMGDAWHTGSAA